MIFLFNIIILLLMSEKDKICIRYVKGFPDDYDYIGEDAYLPKNKVKPSGMTSLREEHYKMKKTLADFSEDLIAGDTNSPKRKSGINYPPTTTDKKQEWKKKKELD